MRIGLTGGGRNADAIVRQAEQAEADGFASLWFASTVTGDPLVAMSLAGRATSRIELGTAVLQTYPCHPTLQAGRVLAASSAMGRPGLTLGIGPSHASAIENLYGTGYDHPGRSTEEYLQLLTPLLRGEAADLDGEDWSAHVPAGYLRPEHSVPVLVSALGPRLLRVAGQVADGVILWMASAQAIENHVAPRVRDAAQSVGRPSPRIVAGLPVAVHDDESEARGAVAAYSTRYADQPNYQRIMEIGGAANPSEAAIVGPLDRVAAELQALLDAGATDIWAAPVPVGEDPKASIRATTDALRELLS
jgi:F420-dependent oxidoreductase-like protein